MTPLLKPLAGPARARDVPSMMTTIEYGARSRLSRNVAENVKVVAVVPELGATLPVSRYVTCPPD